ncbi:MAG: DEAD/DEAH box helicase [Sorangiineae bacterium PRO1]|nr:DEAD/DEAH box helicase [Sorangiineae bacterium PRO1]
MKLRAAFIGVDRHRDARIRELGGAKRDATALWALFSDTLDEPTFRLLVDEQATVTNIRAALDETLGAAEDDDLVILTFSGHGSHDHRLVAHDTDVDAIPHTAIAMEEIATRFRTSRARIVLCVLDCCFSGGAPARVLEDSPVVRDPSSPLSAVAGQGRFIISACNENEAAFELPSTRHGLLTHALVQALRGEGDPVSVASVLDAVMASVRAEAARIGQVQTPVMLGHVEGGLVLPRLRAGSRFRVAFPETVRTRVGRTFPELSVLGLPEDLLSAWQSHFPGGINDLQLSAVNDYAVLAGESLFVVAPTSSGKTFVGELAAAKAIVEGRKAVFLFPYRALVGEKYNQFVGLYGEQLHLRIIRCTGDYQDDTNAFVRGRYDLAALTYEMFLGLVLSRPGVLEQIGLVVIDEAHFISNPGRGIVVELLLSHLLRARERGLVPQLVALSAVVGDLNGFDNWIGCGKLFSDVRPVPLTEGVLDRSGTYQYVDDDGKPNTVSLLPRHTVVQRRDKASSQDVLVPLVKHLLSSTPTEKVLVFRNMRGSTQGCANYLAKEAGLPSAPDAIALLPTTDVSTTGVELRTCLRGGTAFHNTDLSREEREVIESAYRDPAGPVRVLVATSTVAAGVNTPASTVVIVEHAFPGQTETPYTVGEYKNMAGRAGRLGFNERGRSILLADTPTERQHLFGRYVLAKPEPMRSSFDPRELHTWVLRLLAQVSQVREADVPKLLAGTFGGFLAARDSPNWQADTVRQLAELLQRMVTLGLVDRNGDDVQLTLLGRACGRSSLKFESALQLVAMLKEREATGVSAEDLLVMVQGLPEVDATHTPVFKKGVRERVWQGELASIYGQATCRALQRNASDEWVWCARCKRALILRDWINGVAIEDIEKRFSVNSFYSIGAGHVRGFADSARFHLRPAAEIASVLLLNRAPDPNSVDGLVRRLEVGLPEDALPFLSLSLPLQRGEILALRAAGVRTIDALWRLDGATLKKHLGERRATALASLRPATVPIS